jgi:hypothetical protein
MDVKIIPDSIRDVLDYDPETGDLTWKINRGRAKAGALVRSPIPSTGYYRLTYKRKSYLAHRVAWFLHYGAQPEIVDHINHDRTDNRINNLRSVTFQENICNTAKDQGITWTSNGYRVKWRYRHVGRTKSIFHAHFMRIMAVRADHPIGLPAPV